MITFDFPSEEDILFGNMLFYPPIVLFEEMDLMENIKQPIQQGLIPIIIINDPKHHMIKTINKNKPPMVTSNVDKFIVLIGHKENYLS